MAAAMAVERSWRRWARWPWRGLPLLSTLPALTLGCQRMGVKDKEASLQMWQCSTPDLWTSLNDWNILIIFIQMWFFERRNLSFHHSLKGTQWHQKKLAISPPAPQWKTKRPKVKDQALTRPHPYPHPCPNPHPSPHPHLHPRLSHTLTHIFTAIQIKPTLPKLKSANLPKIVQDSAETGFRQDTPYRDDDIGDVQQLHRSPGNTHLLGLLEEGEGRGVGTDWKK